MVTKKQDTKKATMEFWNKSNKYFDCAHGDNNPLQANPALKALFATVKPNNKILDIGCGEGSKLIEIQNKIKNTQCVGVDISKIGIARAIKQNPKIKFVCSDIEKLPFKNDTFDVVYSTYVFEHTVNPQKILTEMIRVTKKGGHCIIVCPNFGSPIYPSPVTPIMSHAIRAVLRDLKYIFKKPKTLEWYDQKPVLTQEWIPDYDTTILPYTYSLKVLYPTAKVSSTWYGQVAGSNLLLRSIRAPFKLLGMIGIYPFAHWGGTLYFNYQKK